MEYETFGWACERRVRVPVAEYPEDPEDPREDLPGTSEHQHRNRKSSSGECYSEKMCGAVP